MNTNKTFKKWIILCVLFFSSLLVIYNNAHAQQSALVTSGMGGGASSTARLTAQMAQQQGRVNDIETCGNKGRLFGPGFGGAQDGDNCLTNMSVNAGGGVSISNALTVNGTTLTTTADGKVGIGTATPTTPLHIEGNTLITNGGLGIGTTAAPASRLEVVGGIKISNDMATCNAAKNGTIRYIAGASPPWQFCNGAAWVNFKQPQCQDNDTEGCYLEEDRSISDPDFIAANIKDGVTILGIRGTYTGNCQLPWGGMIEDGQSVTAYQVANAPCGGSCQSQTRTCTRGILSGSYTNRTCSVTACLSCARPWGGTIPHGSSILAYQYSSVGCGSSCNSQTRSCNNGSLSGSYTNQSCSVGGCSSCSLDGATVSHGSSRTFYLSSRTCGASCGSVGQSRSCNNGTLSGSSSYSKSSCPAQNCASCSLPWGGTLAHSASVTAYQTASVPCGGACISHTRSCNNGSLSGSYTNRTCMASGCASCARPWGGTVAHGSSITAYQASSVPCGSSCNQQTRSCNNGSLSGSYTKQSCSVGSCGCTTSAGVSIANGQCKTLWNSSYGWNGSCGTPRCMSGQVCCTNGSLSTTTYKHSSCSAEPCCGPFKC